MQLTLTPLRAKSPKCKYISRMKVPPNPPFSISPQSKKLQPNRKEKFCIGIALLLVLASSLTKTSAQTIIGASAAEPVQASKVSATVPGLQSWQQAKFGLFLHWGLYSVAGGEWQGRRAKGNEHFMLHERVPLAEYAKLATQFNPVKFDAEQWVLTAKNAGMKYIVITAKHHEGFAMFSSPCSDYNKDSDGASAQGGGAS